MTYSLRFFTRALRKLHLHALATGTLAAAVFAPVPAQGASHRAADPAPYGITAVAPSTAAAPAEQRSTRQRPLLASAARTIRLAAPNKADVAAVRSGRSGGVKRNARAIGFGRDVVATQAKAQGRELAWTEVDGGRATRVDVQSPGAAAVRVAVNMAADARVSVRFAGSAASDDIQGPFSAREIAAIAARDGSFWSPVLDGDTGSMEVFAPAGVDVQSVALRIVRVSHLVVAGSDLKDVKIGIGSAGSCELDVACIAPTLALQNAARSVARLVFTDGTSGGSYYCTGTLINDAAGSASPYLFTANHCIDSQAFASTLNTYWFFDAVTCGSRTMPPFARRSGGATLLGRSADYDWSIVLLRDAPPAGATFSAWRAEPLSTGEGVVDAHHPEGDLKKWSAGTSTGVVNLRDVFDGEPGEPVPPGSFALVRWTRGVTEAGSSGSAVMTLASSGQYYEVRGGLWGGDSSCQNPRGLDAFSRFDRALPLVRQYLTPNVPNPDAEVVAVEFYNRLLDHYFMSTDPAEIADLDTGVHPGWVRTGLRFLAYADPGLAPSGVTPVCRFYSQPGIPGGGDSHFYSGDPQECAATQARFGGDWVYESPSVFYTVLPDRTTGACPSGLVPVYRFLHTARNNHRYTTEQLVREELAAMPGWVAEGYGPAAVIMCAPTA